MRLLLVHNEYGRFSGEEAVFHAVVRLLREHGHEVEIFLRSSANIRLGFVGQVRAFVSGIWSRKARLEFAAVCDRFCPDLVQVQNLYPLISSSVLGEVAKRRIPLVLSVHNYRVFCPTGLMLRNGRPCELCATGGEWHAVWHNCEKALSRSLGYAVRNRVARPRILKNVHCFTVLSRFQRDKFLGWGVPASRVAVLPNSINGLDWPAAECSSLKPYIGFVGRLSAEKGIGVLYNAALRLPGIRFEVAGHSERMPEVGGQPKNMHLRGEVRRCELPGFYRDARLIVIPSICYDSFPFSAIEAMLCKRPVIASRIGGLTDIIEDGVTGFLVEPGRTDAFAEKIRVLWDNPELCRVMGEAGRAKVLREYSADRYIERLMAAYDVAKANAAKSFSDDE